MAGCEIPDRTPHANLLAHAQALREYDYGRAQAALIGTSPL
jgi:hypothetical protein